MGRGNAEMAPMANPGRRRKSDPLDLGGLDIDNSLGKADFRAWDKEEKK
jgi:hypothetical protein